jgi:hypothetical protein
VICIGWAGLIDRCSRRQRTKRRMDWQRCLEEMGRRTRSSSPRRVATWMGTSPPVTSILPVSHLSIIKHSYRCCTLRCKDAYSKPRTRRIYQIKVPLLQRPLWFPSWAILHFIATLSPLALSHLPTCLY